MRLILVNLNIRRVGQKAKGKIEIYRKIVDLNAISRELQTKALFNVF